MTTKSVEELLKEQRNELEVRHMKFLGAILGDLRNQYGDGVMEAVYKIQGNFNRFQWGKIAESMGSNTIEDLIKALWEPMVKDGLEYTMEKTEAGVQMKCTKCHIYDWAKANGLTEWAYHFICANDPFITEGFNPEIGFKRTKTLMQGNDCCDHFYYMKEKND